MKVKAAAAEAAAAAAAAAAVEVLATGAAKVVIGLAIVLKLMEGPPMAPSANDTSNQIPTASLCSAPLTFHMARNKNLGFGDS